jgi:taurine dioxygenase
MNIKELFPFGVEIEGIDLIENDYGSLIRSLLLKHEVVIVRGQDLSAGQWVKACQRIGPATSYKHFVHEDFPEIILVTPEIRNSKSVGLFGDNDLGWHTNGTARENPEIGLGLYLNEADDASSTVTSFANCALAFNDLDQSIKKELLGLNGLFSYENHQMISSGGLEEEVLSRMGGNGKGVIKPLIAKHPVSGKDALYWGVHYMKDILCCDHNRTRDLMEAVSDHCFKDEYIYHHRWQKGDCLFADQLMTQHKRTAFKGRRVAFRTVFRYDESPVVR